MATPISLSDLKQLFDRYGFRPTKARGQNFLFDANHAVSIVHAAKLDGNQTVVEIGTGCGYLTAAMAPQAKKVFTIEIDPQLHEIAQEVLKAHSNIEFFLGDFLSKKEINPAVASRLRELAPFVVIANLPYSVGGTILTELARFQPTVPKMIVMLQKEVAERCVAPAGDRERGPLSIWLQVYYDIRSVRKVPPGVFWPRPKVDSAVIELTRIREPLSADQSERFERIVNTLFQQKRKQVGKAISSLFGERSEELLKTTAIRPQDRAEQLSTEQFLLLSKSPLSS